MKQEDIPRTDSFALSDFHNFERCLFGFLVRHHLQKKYELEEGSENIAIGSILDMVIKKIHASRAYSLPLDYLLTNIFNAAEVEIRQKSAKEGPFSYYGPIAQFLNEVTINRAKDIFKNYYLKRNDQFNRSISSKTFWDCILEGERKYKLWGGPDALELSRDGTPEIVDYKYFEDAQKGKANLDMDLMPKIYTLLCAQELINLGHQQTIFRIRSWSDPEDESLYEEFNLGQIVGLKEFFLYKIHKILSVTEITFCEQPFCKACMSTKRQEWINSLQRDGFTVAKLPTSVEG